MKNFFTTIVIVTAMVVSPLQSADTTTSNEATSTSWLKIGAAVTGSVTTLLALNKARILWAERRAETQYKTKNATGETTGKKYWQAQQAHMQVWCTKANRAQFMKHWKRVSFSTQLFEPKRHQGGNLYYANNGDPRTVWFPGLQALLF